MRRNAQEWTRRHGVAPGLFASGLARADQAQDQPRLAQSHFFFNPLHGDALGPAPAALGRNHEAVTLTQQGFGLFASGAGLIVWLAVDLAGAAGRPVFADACLMPKADGGQKGIFPTDVYTLVAFGSAHNHLAVQAHEHWPGRATLLRRGHGRAVHRALAFDVLPGQGTHVAAHAAGQLLAFLGLAREAVELGV